MTTMPFFPTSASADATPVEDLLVAYAAAGDPDEQDALVSEIVGRTLPLADSIAQRYRGRGVETEDLLQVARTALVVAVRRYRPGAGRGFAAFASPTISGELKRYFRDAGWAVRPPRGLQEVRAEVTAAADDLRQHLGREATAAEIASRTGRTDAEVRDAQACVSAFAPGSLDAPGPQGTTAADLLADPHDLAATVELRAAVHAEIARLTPRERLILHLRFVDERSQREIGEVVGVSQMQVSRLLASMLGRLRAGLGHAAAA
ncbi:sigma-70 family RNA polymerase sigma factor [Phycicoccus sp. CSK15P-2]|uniref:sigma-70 family RNA polymerase sigma factor n=1 Tax=Phycicoccus sp. CSK15P-2 TaxID=2807627 RepID=UPI00194FBD60|nr:sigma-70 family RNA polymerase sigma factor [Phycicoccus sp. CSK15P-2]MBM6406129.1 sigma-70 family RNA polymerase sigma factor [Phycicoccus sp. CSK15P-2]